MHCQVESAGLRPAAGSAAGSAVARPWARQFVVRAEAPRCVGRAVGEEARAQEERRPPKPFALSLDEQEQRLKLEARCSGGDRRSRAVASRPSRRSAPRSSVNVSSLRSKGARWASLLK